MNVEREPETMELEAEETPFGTSAWEIPDYPEELKFGRMFSSFQNWGGLLPTDAEEVLRLFPDPDEERASGPVTQWLAFQEGRPVEEMSLVSPLYRDAYSEELFGEKSKSGVDFYHSIAQRLDVLQDQEDARDESLSAARLNEEHSILASFARIFVGMVNQNLKLQARVGKGAIMSIPTLGELWREEVDIYETPERKSRAWKRLASLGVDDFNPANVIAYNNGQGGLEPNLEGWGSLIGGAAMARLMPVLRNREFRATRISEMSEANMLRQRDWVEYETGARYDPETKTFRLGGKSGPELSNGEVIELMRSKQIELKTRVESEVWAGPVNTAPNEGLKIDGVKKVFVDGDVVIPERQIGAYLDAKERLKAEQRPNSPVNRSGQDSEAKVNIPPIRYAKERLDVEKMAVRFGLQDRVRIHDDLASIVDPADSAFKLKATLYPNTNAGYVPSQGVIHVILSRLQGVKSIQRVLRHEALHELFRNTMRMAYEDIRYRARLMAENDPEWQRIRERYKGENPDILLEEYIVRLGEEGRNLPVHRAFVDGLKRLARVRFGANFDLTDADVHEFLNDANRKIETGEIRDSSGHRYSSTRKTRNEMVLSNRRIDFEDSKDLSHEEAIQLFKNNHAHQTAQLMRGWFEGKFREIQEGRPPDAVVRIQSFIERLPKFRSEMLYRGVPFNNEMQRNEFLKGFEGKKWTNNRPLMSVTKDKKIAFGHAKNSSYPVYLSIRNSFSGRDVEFLASAISRYGWQREVLFFKGQRFKVVDKPRMIDSLGKKIYTITLEEM